MGNNIGLGTLNHLGDSAPREGSKYFELLCTIHVEFRFLFYNKVNSRDGVPNEKNPNLHVSFIDEKSVVETTREHSMLCSGDIA